MSDGTQNIEVLDEVVELESEAVIAVDEGAAEVAEGDAIVEAAFEAVAEPSTPSLAEELDSLRVAFDAEKGTLIADLNAASERIERLESHADEREALIEKMEAEAEAAKTAVAAIRTKLANPAFSAAVEGEQEAAEVGGEAEDGKSVLDQLKAIQDPKEKSKFRREHAQEITEAQRELAGK